MKHGLQKIGMTQSESTEVCGLQKHMVKNTASVDLPWAQEGLWSSASWPVAVLS